MLGQVRESGDLNFGFHDMEAIDFSVWGPNLTMVSSRVNGRRRRIRNNDCKQVLKGVLV